MIFQQKNKLATLISLTSASALYAIVIAREYLGGRFADGDNLSFLGAAVVCMVLATILASIALSIAINFDRNGSVEPVSRHVIDERDRAVETDSQKFGNLVTGIGFSISMAALALGLPVFWILNMIVLSFAAGAATSCVRTLTKYWQDA